MNYQTVQTGKTIKFHSIQRLSFQDEPAATIIHYHPQKKDAKRQLNISYKIIQLNHKN